MFFCTFCPFRDLYIEKFLNLPLIKNLNNRNDLMLTFLKNNSCNKNFRKNIVSNNLISNQILILIIKGECVMGNHNNKEILKCDLKLLAYKLLPEIKKYFADEKIQKEFQSWIKRNNQKFDK